MTGDSSKLETRAALDREAYFRVAYELLADGGREAVTIGALCQRLGVSKGSFYHHFGDLSDFVGAFAERWKGWVAKFIETYLNEPDPLRRMDLLINHHSQLMTAAEPEVRAWGRSEPVIAEALRAIDAIGRTEFGRQTFGLIAGDDETGSMLATMGDSMAVGMQLSYQPANPDRWLRVVVEWTRCCLHLDIEVVRDGGRLRGRVIGSTNVPVPHYRGDGDSSGSDTHRVRSLPAIPDAFAQLASETAQGPAAFFRAATTVLAEEGSDAVTVAGLCDRLWITRGSFYHHFSSMTGFVEALARQWEATSIAMLDARASEPNPLHRTASMWQANLACSHPAHRAWHAWGRTQPAVGDALRRVERHSEELFAATLTDLLGDVERAAVLADMGAAIAIGLSHHEPPLEPEIITALGLEWIRRCLDHDAGIVMGNGVQQLVLTRRDGLAR